MFVDNGADPPSQFLLDKSQSLQDKFDELAANNNARMAKLEDKVVEFLQRIEAANCQKFQALETFTQRQAEHLGQYIQTSLRNVFALPPANVRVCV